MTTNGTNDLQGRGGNEGLSKRQQMKLEQAIKIIQSQETQQIKHPKRRAQSHPHPYEPNQRKQVKIDANQRGTSNDQPLSSPLNSSDPASRTPSLHPSGSAHPPIHLNPSYPLPQGDPDIFNYLLCYTLGQTEKQMEKQSVDWSSLNSQPSKPLNIVSNSASLQIVQKLDAKFKEVRDRLKEPFGKAHREFNLKFIKGDFLK